MQSLYLCAKTLGRYFLDLHGKLSHDKALRLCNKKGPTLMPLSYSLIYCLLVVHFLNYISQTSGSLSLELQGTLEFLGQ